MAQDGISVAAYAYALNNPVRFTDKDGMRVRLMDQAARSDAFAMSLNPQMKYVYDWMDASSAVYEFWGNASVDPGARPGVSTVGGFSAGELSGTNMCNARGGTLRLDRRTVSRRATAAHEMTHGGLFDYKTGPRPFDPDGMAVPPIIQMLLDDASPSGGLTGDQMDPMTGHGYMRTYWEGVVGP